MNINNLKIGHFIGVGLLIRLLYYFIGVDFILASPYINNDTFSYSESFLNLLNNGLYTHTLDVHDAKFGRLPGYPFFWGLHYLIFGSKYVYQLVGFTQLLLDVIAIKLVYDIILKISENIIQAKISAIIYSTFPFIILWITLNGTELLGSFVVLLFFRSLFCLKNGNIKVLILGLIVTFGFYIRPYLGILLPISLLYFMLHKENFIKYSLLLIVIFTVSYSFWPLRNYINQGELVFLKKKGAGYHRYAEDIRSTRSWIYCFSKDSDSYLDNFANPKEKIIIPELDYIDKEEFKKIVTKARTCGSGFYFWNRNKIYKGENCNSDISNYFNLLKHQHKEKYYLKYWTVVPFSNIYKSFFKNKLNKMPKSETFSKLIKLSFSYRSILIILGFGSLLFVKRNPNIIFLYLFPLFMYLYICFIHRQLEMRYLIQADIILLVLSSYSIIHFINNIQK